MLRGTHPRLPSEFRSLFTNVGPDQIGGRIRSTTSRCNFLLKDHLGREALTLLEEIALSELRPAFEGRWEGELVD